MSEKEKFTVFCPECNLMVEAHAISEAHGGFASRAINPFDDIDSEYYGDIFWVCLCSKCKQVFLIKQQLYGISGEFGTICKETVLYPLDSKIPLKDVPISVKNAYIQALRSFSASLWEPCVLMCRKCLEEFANHEQISGKDLYEKIENLSINGIIDSRLKNWSHEIRLVGNEAAHIATKPITKQDARDVLDFTEAILLYVFSLTSRFDSFRKRRGKYC
jgi:hypothetical protein